jgi:hypothetical protein
MFDFMFLNLKTFCFLSAALIAYILFKRGKPNQQGALIIFGVWTLLAMKTMYNYVFPAPSVFPNTRYHHLEHQGFKFNNTLWLVKEADRRFALWDDPNHKGALSLQNNAATGAFNLQSQGFTEPIFVQTASNSPTFRLSNPILEQNIAKSIEIKLADSFYVKIEINNFFNPTWYDKWQNRVKADSSHYICTLQYDGHKATHKSNFNAPLKQGYSVGDILAKTPNLPDLPDWTDALFGKTYLVRTQQNRLDAAKNATASLVLMPSPALLAVQPTISIDGSIQKISKDAGNKNIVLPKGQKFYIGFGSQRSPILLTSTTNGNKLLYEFGDKKPLKDLDEKDEGLFMTSDSRAVVDNDALAGYYYPLFDSDDCVHHFRAGIQYFKGSAKENLAFRILSYDKNYVSSKVPAQEIGKTIELPSQDAQGATWLFAVNDMRADNPLQWWQMLLLMFVMFAGITLCLYGAPDFSVTEIVVYIVLMAMMTIRSVLLWRMGTFAPYEDISYLMYNRMIESGHLLGFTTLKMFQNTFIGVVVFFLGIWIFKNWENWCTLKWIGSKLKWIGSKVEQFVTYLSTLVAQPMKAPILMMAGYGFLLVLKLGVPSLERFGNIFLPAVWFFIVDYFINRNILENNVPQLPSRQNQNNPIGLINGFKLLRGINWLIGVGYFAISDAGFGAIFVIFTVLYWLLRTIFYEKDILGQGTKSFIIPLIVLMVILTCGPRIMSWLFINPTVTGIVIAIALLGGAAAAFFLPKQGKIVLAPQFHQLSMVFAGGLLVGAIGIGLKGGDVIRKKAYIKYRSEVLFKKVDDIILNEAADSKNSQKILEAAQNQWFIAYNQDKSDKVWFRGFELLTHFQKGSSYTTQTTDLVTVRYVIGEHGEGLIYLVLLLWFGIVAAIATQWHHEQRPLTGTLLAASVLLFSIALFIWMAATNRFVFFGQDMPLLSLQSLLTLVFAFFVMFAVVIGQQETTASATLTVSRTRAMVFNTQAGVGGYHAYPIVILMVFLVAFVNKKTSKTIDSFDIADTMDKTKESYERLNEQFEAFQAEFESDTLQKMSEKELLKRFDEQEKITTSKANENSALQDPFSRSLFKKLKEEDVNKISPDKILHLRRTERDGFYKFAVNNQFYRLRSPDVDKNAWRGNILAPNRDEIAQFQVRAGGRKDAVELDTRVPKRDLMLQKGFDGLNAVVPNAKVTFLPGSWMADKQHLVILRTEKAVAGDASYRFLIQNSREMIDGNSANQFAYALKNHDAVRLVNPNQTNQDRYRIDYARSNYDFWAKNVWLNGKQRFFYPAGEKSLWVYHFSNLMSLRHNQLIDKEKDKNLFANVEISLDPNLTTSVYDAMKLHYQGTLHKQQKVENDRAFNLVAMDGNGRVALMADYKKILPARINPNKIERYQPLITKFYLEGNPLEERRIFGNGCLQRLSPGVGSSLKPIVYDAVTSAYNFNWNDLVLTPPVVGNDVLESVGNHKILYQYAGKQVGKWTLINGDKNFEICRGRDYLAYSSNVYHSLIVFIGSFEKTAVAKRDFFKPSAQLGLSERFPQMQYGGQTVAFSKWAEDFSTERSLLATGLHINYDLPLFYKHVGDSARAMQTNLMQGFDDAFFKQTQSTYKLWSFPEYSLFSQVDRNKNKAIEGLRQSTVGGFPVQITPLKMAEMAGKMVSANPSYRATVQEKQGKPRQGALFVDDSWGGEQAFLDFKSNTILASMHQMAATMDGTGNSVKEVVNKIQQYDGKTFHFYGKTGTINSPYLLNGKMANVDNRLFMLVISKEKLHDRHDLTKDVLRNNRFYVLYFSFQRSQGDKVGKLIGENIEKVIQSSSFKNYMK